VSSARVFTLCLATLLSVGVVAADNPAHEKGTLTIDTASGHKFYNLKAGPRIYEIGNCGDFQNGQEVEFIVKEDKVYIAHEGAKDYKCSIQATTESLNPDSAPTPNDMSGPRYLKGTILGYSVRRDLHVSGGGGSSRKAKVYELQGPDKIYQVDYCGAFQAGEFSPGQVVEFRVDAGDGRLYIRHDGNKEYSCQLEGTRKPDAPSGGVTAPSTSVGPAAAPSTARLSITSVPDGADIEIDGNFAGNTPSDLEVPEGEHSIVVRKSGYKNWERKMKVVAGSSIRLNAEMEKSTNP
jgi:PEGA domain